MRGVGCGEAPELSVFDTGCFWGGVHGVKGEGLLPTCVSSRDAPERRDLKVGGDLLELIVGTDTLDLVGANGLVLTPGRCIGLLAITGLLLGECGGERERVTSDGLTFGFS